jgi:DNA-binding MarR family transcriptional regulator
MNDASLPIGTIHQIRDTCLCLATQRAARRLARRFDRLFAPLGITNGQFSFMVALAGQWKPRLGELADFLAMDQTTMTAAVKTLEKRGLVILQSDKADARVRRPALTLAGREITTSAAQLWQREHAILQEEFARRDSVDLAQRLGELG